MKKLFLILCGLGYLILLNACAQFPIERSPQSGYAGYNNSFDSHEVSLRDIGPTNTAADRSVSLQDSDSYRQQMYRKNLEENLKTSEERSQYLRYKPYMSEAERIEFLQMSDIYARERWAQNKGISSNPEKYSRGLASIIEQNDIAIGMNKDSVRDSWGDPDIVEVSGNPRFENERWKFSVPIQTAEGYQIQDRMVYFQGGHVVGWTSQ